MNLPRSKKMMDPRYQEIKRHQVPVATPQPGRVEVTVICGTVSGVKGRWSISSADPEYLDITLRPDNGFLHKVGAG